MALNKILIAVDEERFATEIVDFVVNYKWPANVAFRLLHVVELSPVFDVARASYRFLPDVQGSRTLRLRQNW